ncbi:MAG: family 43 glycosylhydrolase [Paludibacter sp.]|nr:family 43 glycosylhydrolase [Paludibacter sp.]
MKKILFALCVFALLVTACKEESPQLTVWTVSFNSNSGSPVPDLNNVADGSLVRKPDDPARLNYSFGGWFTDNNTFQNEWLFTKYKVTSDTTLYAKWISKTAVWTVTFETNGGNTIAPLRNVETGAKIQAPDSPTKGGSQFAGWFTDNLVFEKEWKFDQNVVISDTTLYAKWTPEPETEKIYDNLAGLVPDCADPYILKHEGMYYLYGTGGNDGIKVYRSPDMVTWSAAVGATKGYALHKDFVWGEKWFWAPEVYYIDNRFYMFYSAEEKISVAESSSPLGPFTQSAVNQKPFHENTKEIDTHLFIDDNGKKYLYFVRFTNGNEIWVAELNDDLRSIKESTLKLCFGTSQNWEKSTAEPYPNSKVNEGPFMMKHNGWYYLTYSANHYANPNYGVGYATSRSPLGPWTKYYKNPVLTGNSKIRGVGHHSFVNVSDSCGYMVYHSHFSPTVVHPRKVCIDPYEFVPSTQGSPDVLKVNGPTTSPQVLCK